MVSGWGGHEPSAQQGTPAAQSECLHRSKIVVAASRVAPAGRETQDFHSRRSWGLQVRLLLPLAWGASTEQGAPSSTKLNPFTDPNCGARQQGCCCHSPGAQAQRGAGRVQQHIVEALRLKP